MVKHVTRQESLTTQLFEMMVKLVIVEMLINWFSNFDDRFLLHELLLSNHCHVCTRQKNGDANEQYKLLTHTVHTDTQLHNQFTFVAVTVF